MITIYTQKTLIDLFRQAAEDHVSVNFFNSGDKEYVFAENHDKIFPAVYVQTLGSSYQDAQQTHSFGIYAADKPAIDAEQDHSAFEYDSNLATSRDALNQIIKDITATVKFANQQSFILDFNTPIAESIKNTEGEIGLAVTLTITQDCPLTTSTT